MSETDRSETELANLRAELVKVTAEYADCRKQLAEADYDCVQRERELDSLRDDLAKVTGERDNRQAQLDMMNTVNELVTVDEIEMCKAYSKLDNAELIKERDALREALAVADKALEPFAIADKIDKSEPDNEWLDKFDNALTVGDIRAASEARTLIAKTGGGDAIAKAVEAEREACAKIAESLFNCGYVPDVAREDRHAREVGNRIAVALRARTTEPKT